MHLVESDEEFGSKSHDALIYLSPNDRARARSLQDAQYLSSNDGTKSQYTVVSKDDFANLSDPVHVDLDPSSGALADAEPLRVEASDFPGADHGGHCHRISSLNSYTSILTAAVDDVGGPPSGSSPTISSPHTPAGRKRNDIIPRGKYASENSAIGHCASIESSIAKHKTFSDNSNRYFASPSLLEDFGGNASLRSRTSVIQLEGVLTQHYDVENSTLGVGSFGVVRKAKDKKTKVWVAVKSIHISRLKNVTDFENELSIFRRLKHQNILRLISYHNDNSDVHLIMELCKGCDLHSHVISGQLRQDLIPTYMWAMLSGISYCHLHRVCHRDIKLENYMFWSYENTMLKLIDFGLSQMFTPGVPMTDRQGTSGYVAPEVLRKPTAYDEKCDVWSIGICLFICYMLRSPFDAKLTDNEINKLTLASEIELNDRDWQPWPEAKDLIKKCLTKDPKERPAARQLMKIPWLREYSPPNPCCTVL